MSAHMFKDVTKRIEKYYSKYTWYNSAVHLVGGIGIGFLLANPIAMPHPVRWGVSLLALSLIGHYYAYMKK